MNYQTDTCSGCSKRRPLINRKHKLCQQCNTIRLHPEGKKYAPIKKKSDKQRDREQELYAVYEKIIKEREYRCTGCGTEQYLSPSHIIPRSQREDLITDENNITWHCEDRFEIRGCHTIHEHGSLEERKRLLDFDENMAYVKSVDITRYYLWGGE